MHLFLKVLTWWTLPNLVTIMATLLWQEVDSMGTPQPTFCMGGGGISKVIVLCPKQAKSALK